MILTPEQYPGLPKWPAAFVTGKTVTPAQAKDIIFRTDTSVRYPSDYMGGNDKRFQDQCITMFGWKPIIERETKWFELHKIEDEVAREAAREALLPASSGFESLWDVRTAWQTEMGMVSTEYVDNSHLSTAYIGGPHGWVSPDGKVFSEGHNYGKWPSVEAIVQDWTALLEAFPYLDLVCTLFSGEACEDHAQAVCTIVVRNGTVQVRAYDGALHEEYGAKAMPANEEFNVDKFVAQLNDPFMSHEKGWPVEWIREFSVKSKAAMQKVAPFLFP